MPHPRSIAPVIAALFALCVAATITTREGAARSHAQPDAIAVEALPPEARTTLERIHEGGPFPYSRDGVVFNNREHILPTRPRGYYHEYTVPSPGQRTRGARRIICGGDVISVSECYYSDDHYQTFRRIRP